MPRGPSPANVVAWSLITPGVHPQLLEKVFLALVESPAVLKLYKYIFDIQRLVDPPNLEALIEGGVENPDVGG